MIAELQRAACHGESNTEVLNWFVAKYGATILAAPIRGGFDNVAWIVPVAIFLLATIGTFWVVWLWKRRALQMAGAAAETTAATFPRPANPIHRTRHRMQHCANASAARRSTEWDSSPPLPH